MWIWALEKFHSDVGYKEKIIEVNSKMVLENQLSKFVCVMTRQNSGNYYATSVRSCVLRFVINGKLKTLSTKGLGEHVGADGLTLRLDNHDAQAEVISLPKIKNILNNYEFYFTKCLVITVMNFYLKPMLLNSGIQIGSRNISNHLGKKTAMQLLKELEYSNSVVISITRHKFQKGLAAYEQPKSVMQHKGLNGFFNMLKQLLTIIITMPYLLTIMTMPPLIIIMNTVPLMIMKPLKALLVNAFDDLEVFSNGSNNVLTEHNQNIHDTDDEREKDKSAKKNNQKEKVRGGKKNLKILNFLKNFF
ncbi:6729_t:CDS:2 [Cetraspora pellucida]|uniref:6729_t:CDS:1 n=1 Tax=Cetraspora pellucida TaxID=1433469 RepID=A0A9N9B3U7_9GLOM|nr:6729_t:CDS:2 [Cetraspora pellucida]